MQNIYDIRKDEQLLYILPTNNNSSILLEEINAAVIIYLYYEDTLKRYISYIEGIPESIPVYIFSSKSEVLEILKRSIQRKAVIYGLKQNRGRDVSALLVAAKDIVGEHECFCFIHDKKSKSDYHNEDMDFWISNLLDNMLCSKDYINNILNIFEKNREIGLLVPPESYGEYMETWYGDTWCDDYDNTVHLAKKMCLNSDIDVSKQVITSSTVFWARTEALKKLFQLNWQYDDFAEEPMPVDGTISHVIERILGYVAQDAGYKTGTVMTDKYASELMLRVQDDMRRMFFVAQENLHIHNLHEIYNLDERRTKLKKYVEQKQKVYIYGAGDYGTMLHDFLNDMGIAVDGYIVSTGKRNKDYVNDLKVYEIQELSPDTSSGIVIGVSYEFRNQIEEILQRNGFTDYIYGY